MEYVVVKVGAEMFDAAHAYGLGIFLAYASQSTVDMTDEGSYFRLRSRAITRRVKAEQCIKDVLKLPSIERLKVSKWQLHEPDLAVNILDGLLAVLFTSMGLRAVSVRDTLSKEKFNPAAAEQSLAKAAAAVERWAKGTARIARRQSDWMEHLLSGYTADRPSVPIPVIKRKRMIIIPMTIDPIFSYSTRHPLSDGLIADKTNVSIDGTPYAPILAIVGAARFLHAYRVAEDLVVFSMPIAGSLTLSSETALPPLSPSSQPVDHTLIRQWIERGWEQTGTVATWLSLAYQILQTQGAQQSISRGRGALIYAWREAIERYAGSAIVDRWRNLLRIDQRMLSFELDLLIDTLLHRRISSWIEHLCDVARQAYNDQAASLILYNLFEAKGMIRAMSVSTTSPLRVVLERDQGTLRFGHALRLLGRFNPAPLRDLIDSLDAVRSCDALIHDLAQAVQECHVASAKTKFIIIPDDHDLIYLLDDVERFGAQTVAQLLIILSALDYPRIDKQERSASDTASVEE